MSRNSAEAGLNPGGRQRVRVRDFMSRDGVGVESGDDRLSLDDTLIEGELLHQELRSGLFLHVGDAIETHRFTVTSYLREGLSSIIFLDGEVDLKIGDRRFAFRGDWQSSMQGTAIVSDSSESFQRATRQRQHVRHVVVSATKEWLDGDGMDDAGDRPLATRLLKDHLAHSAWPLTARTVELVRQIIQPSAFAGGLHRLYLEGRAIEIVAETIAALTRTDRQTDDRTLLGRHDLQRLRRAKELIHARLAEPLSVEVVARGSGTSNSGLQRIFRVSEGSSVFEYIRLQRLERAFTALRSGEASVQHASDIAGYASPANFATAFRRRFGLTPRDAMKSDQTGRARHELQQAVEEDANVPRP